ncbi:unnamed protein product [Kuraishia capsulata CBS 1993]|uniref:Uncharacterized protein n=1 Tax=Kuraishia capsulata CBS 1993 TaxID=1382522 RepID=W6MUE1_9ASCO|nr:unnamed protein product [Kuraishia capsulata CBS 1993]
MGRMHSKVCNIAMLEIDTE